MICFLRLLVAIGTLMISIGIYILVSKMGDAVGGGSGYRSLRSIADLVSQTQ